MRFKTFLENRVYKGDALEKGGTSIKGKGAAPALRDLFKKGLISKDDVVLDYGAGKYARNADFLRENGVKVFAYDPYNGSGSEGWEIGQVAGILPNEKFDIVFTSFVLNVVPDHIEDEILKETKSIGKNEYHITRNMDIFDTVKRALDRKDKIVGSFFLEQYADSELKKSYEDGTLSDDEILDFCYFGVQTSKGFQRIPKLEDKGYTLLRKTSGFKVYTK